MSPDYFLRWYWKDSLSFEGVIFEMIYLPARRDLAVPKIRDGAENFWYIRSVGEFTK